MGLKTIFYGVFMMCSLAAGQHSLTGKLPATLQLNNAVRVELSQSGTIANKLLLNVQLQIQNAVPGTEIIIEDALTGEQIGVISPFGRIGRNATESFLIPLRASFQDKALTLNFKLRPPVSGADQKITIKSVTLQGSE